MYIKSINNVIGYKNLPDNFSVSFDESKTYIVGANFQRKSTVGSLFNWCLTGTSLNGKEKEPVANDRKKVTNVVVDISFVDNFGIEHRLIREKGKEINLTLDGKEIKQENLVQFYKDKDIFLVAHNPYYFWSLEPKQQKDLIRNILPSIDPSEAFDLLEQGDKDIIKEPIPNLTSYTNNKNQEIDTLEKEYNKNIGTLETLKRIALSEEGQIVEFKKEQELANLQERYNCLSMNLENSNLEDLQRQINAIDRRLTEIITEDLAKISENYDRESKKLQEVDNEVSICPYCRQEIKSNDVKNHLKAFYTNELRKYQEKANELKEKAKKLNLEKQEKQLLYNKLNTTDMKILQLERQELKSKIESLTEEKNKALFNNHEVQIRAENIQSAKLAIKDCEKVQNEIKSQIELNQLQKKIANKLKILVIEAQKEKIKEYLHNVDIEFSKLIKSTGEIAECCNIQYLGRDFKKLSKSEQARACLEISNVFNNISGIKAPIFFDDAESTTDVPEIPDTQLIVSIVIKYNSLEILYDYSDVLERKEKSIKKEIEERSCYEVPLAA